MKAIRIVSHALRQVFGNIRQVLLLSVAPLMIQTVPVAAAVLLLDAMRGTRPGWGFIVLVAAIGLAAALCLVWLAVRWHRFVLLNEQKNLLSPPPRAVMLRYVATALAIFLIMLAAGVLTELFISAFSLSGPVLLAAMVLGVLFYAFILALAVALPGAAIGASHPIRSAWRAMSPAAGTVIALVIIGFLCSVLVNAVLTAADLSALPIGAVLILNLLFYWAWTLISLSVLTTLWGHYVEGRPLR